MLSAVWRPCAGSQTTLTGWRQVPGMLLIPPCTRTQTWVLLRHYAVGWTNHTHGAPGCVHGVSVVLAEAI